MNRKSLKERLKARKIIFSHRKTDIRYLDKVERLSKYLLQVWLERIDEWESEWDCSSQESASGTRFSQLFRNRWEDKIMEMKHQIRLDTRSFERWQYRHEVEDDYAYRQDKKRKLGTYLARNADLWFDEHGSVRGDYLNTIVLDAVLPDKAKELPYLDSGGRGLALIAVNRKRIYAKSYEHGPLHTYNHYLLGKNETDTFFAHSIPHRIQTVQEAISWIWAGQEMKIICRQGDIALIPALTSRVENCKPRLPGGHRIEGGFIVHDTHPPIPVPLRNQKIIIGKRFQPRVRRETRD